MPHIHTNRRRSALVALSVIIVALVLAACGSGSPSKTTSATASAANASGTTTAPPAGFAGRFSALRQCLSQHGINLPKRPAGQRGPGGGLGALLGGRAATRELPKGVTRPQFEAVLKACGGVPPVRGGTRGFGLARSARFKAALQKFAACLRRQGINLPAPNTSGAGPIFDTKGIDTQSAKFKAATATCAGQLRSSSLR
jgi:hypothetical protein